MSDFLRYGNECYFQETVVKPAIRLVCFAIFLIGVGTILYVII